MVGCGVRRARATNRQDFLWSTVLRARIADIVSMTRRDLLPGIAESLLLASLASLSVTRNALARSVAPGVVAWLKEMNDLALSVKEKAISQADWQTSMARLLSTVAMGDLLELIDFERL